MHRMKLADKIGAWLMAVCGMIAILFLETGMVNFDCRLHHDTKSIDCRVANWVGEHLTRS